MQVERGRGLVVDMAFRVESLAEGESRIHR